MEWMNEWQHKCISISQPVVSHLCIWSIQFVWEICLYMNVLTSLLWNWAKMKWDVMRWNKINEKSNLQKPFLINFIFIFFYCNILFPFPLTIQLIVEELDFYFWFLVWCCEVLACTYYINSCRARYQVSQTGTLHYHL